MMSSFMYIVLKILDFGLQLLIIFGIYGHFSQTDFDLSQLDELLSLTSYSNAAFIAEIIAFSICFIVVTLILILTFKKLSPSFYSEKNITMRAIGIFLTLLRTILLTYFILVIACNLTVFNNDETIKIV